MNSEELGKASRAELQEYLEGRGFAVYDTEDTEQLRTAAVLDAEIQVNVEFDERAHWKGQIEEEIEKWRAIAGYTRFTVSAVAALARISELCGNEIGGASSASKTVRDVAHLADLLLEMEDHLRPDADKCSTFVQEWLDKVDRLNLKLDVVTGAERYGEGADHLVRRMKDKT